MPAFLGLDGFRLGWVAAWIDDRGDHGFDYSPGVRRLLAMPHKRAMIDMPIGLPERGRRQCDVLASKLVGTSVFVGVRRNLLEFQDPDAVNQYCWEHEGKGTGISRQLWNLKCKVREVDDVMTPERQATIGEAHPELIFWRLAGERRLPPKKSTSGLEQRVALLRAQGFDRLPKWLTQRHGTGIGRDDLIDACACAVAARDSISRLGGEETDPRGLRMEINY